MKIKGEKVTLISMELKDRDEFYRLATESLGADFWYGKDKKGEIRKEKFFSDWKESYFDQNLPQEGQCFWIIVGGEKIGQVNYNKIDKENKNVELDIIIGAKENMGKSFGSDALKTLMKYLFDNFEVHKIWIGARANNPRAIRAYEKVGFKKEGLLREEDYFEGKFVDCIRFGILRKEFKENL